MSSAFFLVFVYFRNSSGSRIENHSGVDFLIEEVAQKDFGFPELGNWKFAVEPCLFCGFDDYISFSWNVVDDAI